MANGDDFSLDHDIEGPFIQPDGGILHRPSKEERSWSYDEGRPIRIEEDDSDDGKSSVKSRHTQTTFSGIEQKNYRQEHSKM